MKKILYFFIIILIILTFYFFSYTTTASNSKGFVFYGGTIEHNGQDKVLCRAHIQLTSHLTGNDQIICGIKGNTNVNEKNITLNFPKKFGFRFIKFPRENRFDETYLPYIENATYFIKVDGQIIYEEDGSSKRVIKEFKNNLPKKIEVKSLKTINGVLCAKTNNDEELQSITDGGFQGGVCKPVSSKTWLLQRSIKIGKADSSVEFIRSINMQIEVKKIL